MISVQERLGQVTKKVVTRALDSPFNLLAYGCRLTITDKKGTVGQPVTRKSGRHLGTNEPKAKIEMRRKGTRVDIPHGAKGTIFVALPSATYSVGVEDQPETQDTDGWTHLVINNTATQTYTLGDVFENNPFTGIRGMRFDYVKPRLPKRK